MSILLHPLDLLLLIPSLRFPVPFHPVPLRLLLLTLFPLALQFSVLSALRLLQLRPVLSFLRLFQLMVLLSQSLPLSVLLTLHPVLTPQAPFLLAQDLPFLILMVLLLFLQLPLTPLSIWLPLFRVPLR